MLFLEILELIIILLGIIAFWKVAIIGMLAAGGFFMIFTFVMWTCQLYWCLFCRQYGQTDRLVLVCFSIRLPWRLGHAHCPILHHGPTFLFMVASWRRTDRCMRTLGTCMAYCASHGNNWFQ